MIATNWIKRSFGLVLALAGTVVSPACPGEPAPAQPTKTAAAGQPAVDGNDDPLPKGAVARLGTLRFRHGDGIGALAVSPDGKTLATLSPGRPNGVKVWNMADGRLRYQFSNLGYRDAAFLPDGKTLVLGTWEAGVVFIDLVTGKEIRRFDAPRASDAIAVSPDGNLLATWSLDLGENQAGPSGGTNVVCLFDTATGKLLHRIERAQDMAVVGDIKRSTSSSFTSIKFLRFTADGKSIAAGSWDQTIAFWDVASGKPVRQFGGAPQPAHCFALSADGNTLAMACADRTVRGYDLHNGKEIFKIAPDVESVSALAFAPDNTSLAVGGAIMEGKRRLNGDGVWDIATGKKIHTLAAISTQLAFTPDGKRLVSGDWWGAIRLFNPATGQESGTPSGHGGLVLGLIFTPDGKTLISEGNDSTLRWWDLETSKQVNLCESYCIGLQAHLALSADGKLLASRSDDNTISIIDARTGQELHRLRGHPGYIYPVAFSPDGKSLTSAERDGPAIVWDVAAAKEIRRIDHPFPESGGETVALSGDGTLWAVARQSHVAPFGGPHEWTILDTATKQERGKFTLVNTQSPAVFAFSPDRKLLIAGTYNGMVCTLDTRTGKEMLRFVADDFSVSTLAVSPDGNLIATSGSKWKENVIRVWQVKTGKMVRQFPANGFQVYSFAFSPDSTLLASGGSDGTIVLWDVTE